jgi:DNA (cytosine-5)-methyltransferase 1
MALGLRDAGLDVRFAFDAWGIATRTYEQNIGPHVLCAKAEELTGAQLLEAAGLQNGHCDLVVGGPPCQGFSVQRRGEDFDARNDLIQEFIRLVTEIHPSMFLMENVTAIQGTRGRPHLKKLLQSADAAGYCVKFAVLNAAEYGVPQTRRRFFLVGELGDAGTCFEFPSPTHSEGSFVTVRQAITDLPDPGEPNHAIPNHQQDRISDLNRVRISHVPPGGGRAHIPEELRLPCHKVSVDVAGHRGVYGRLSWDKPAGTITTKCNSFTRGRFAHPEEHRNITMREAARLQSFPDSFVFTGSKVDVAHQIGNAVPPLLARHLGTAIMGALVKRNSGQTRKPTGEQLKLSLASAASTDQR